VIRESAAAVLGISSADRIDTERGFFDMGMDSLMAVDFKGKLEKIAGEKLPASLTFNYPNVAALAGFLMELGGPPAGASPAADEASMAHQAAEEGPEPSEDELAARLMRKLQTL
jgi:acyl carrier protein